VQASPSTRKAFLLVAVFGSLHQMPVSAKRPAGVVIRDNNRGERVPRAPRKDS